VVSANFVCFPKGQTQLVREHTYAWMMLMMLSLMLESMDAFGIRTRTHPGKGINQIVHGTSCGCEAEESLGLNLIMLI